MTDSKVELSKVSLLEKAAQEFHDRLIFMFNELEASLHEVVKSPQDYVVQRQFKRLVQNMSDRSGVFSLPGIKKHALEIEKILSYPLWSGDAEQSAQVDSLKEHLAEIGKICRKQISVFEATQFKAENYGWKSNNRLDELLIVIVEEEPAFVEAMTALLRKKKLRVKHVKQIDELGELLQSVEPATLIVNSEMAKKSIIPFETMISASGHVPPPIIMVSDIDDMPNRLQALRSGATIFQAKAVGPEKIAKVLDTILETQKTGLLKVLVVGESRALTEYLAMVFHNVGGRVGIVVNPMELLPPLRRFRPTLILIDLRMASCSGFELQRIIRQEEGFSQTPIMFLSSDSVDLNLIYERNLDLTNFISLPASQVRLVRSVLNAIKVSKTRLSHTTTDSLSGHLNREAFIEKIEAELTRCKRSKNSFCIALIELDAFKGVKNSLPEDALKKLSEVLKKTFRTSDYIGRLEDGLFGALLIDTDMQGAAIAINKTRERWHELQNSDENIAEFGSISSGLSMFPVYNQSKALMRAAQAALDAAKLGGGANSLGTAK